MENHKIMKLNNGPFDFLIIATSCENPLSHFNEIRRFISIEYGRILFDLTLNNGMKSNRYVACDYHCGDTYLKSCYVVNDVNDQIKTITKNYFMENLDIIQNSVIPNSLKFLLKSGMI
jgi:hypothetical protein